MLPQVSDSGLEFDFFEGAEKLIEIWFSQEGNTSETSDLRSISREKLDILMAKIKCKILSKIESGTWDAYVLSESSLFIEKKRVILKTCGTTTPLAGIKKLVEIVRSETSFDHISKVFYSRKSFLKPKDQEFPHNCFKNESEYLLNLFATGKSHYFGDKDNEWYLFVYEDDFFNHVGTNDTTYELLMRPIGREEAANFIKGPLLSGQDSKECRNLTMRERSSLEKWFKNTNIDDHEFYPYGYSMNALSESSYHSIHVTPQDNCSYASYETNAPESEGNEWCARIIDVFKPTSFILTLITSNKKFTKYVDLSSMWKDYCIEIVDHVELCLHSVKYAKLKRKCYS